MTEVQTSISVSDKLLSVDQIAGATYQWIDCDNENNPIDNETNSSFEPKSNGSYAVNIEQNRCLFTSECVDFSVVLGLIQNKIDNHIKIFPIPSNNNLNIEFGSGFSGTCKLVDLTGSIIKEHLFRDKTSVKLNLDISKGIYLIRIISENGQIAIFKIAKE